MKFFNDEIEPLLLPGGEPVEWLKAMETVLKSNYFGNTWTVERGSSRRIVFVFPSDVCLSWCGDSDGEEINLLQVWFNREDQPQDISVCPVGDGEWNSETGTWDMTVDATLLSFVVDDAVEKYGKPTLFLPWAGFMYEEGAELVLGKIAPDMPFLDAVGKLSAKEIAELREEFETSDYLTFFDVIFAAMQREGIVLPVGWGDNPVQVGEGNDLMPPLSPNARFQKFIQFIEEKPDWIVVWDECCAACSRGSIEWLAKSKGIPEDSPNIILWGQNSQYSYTASGLVYLLLYAGDGEEENKILTDAIQQFGLDGYIDIG